MTQHLQTLGLAVSLLSGLCAAPAWSQGVRLLDHLILEETKIDGEKIGEFSALVVSPDGNGLIAVSDRGYLAGWPSPSRARIWQRSRCCPSMS